MSQHNLHQDINGIYTKTIQETISYPDSGNDNCFAIEKNSFWFNHRNNVIHQILLKFPFPGNFADIGGGNGYQAAFIGSNFPDKDVFLIEPGYNGCLNAKKYGVKNIYNVPFSDFDFHKNNIGGVGLFDVIEHIENDVSFLKEIADSSTKGTRIYITVPAHKSLWSDTDDYAGHFRRYNSKMIRKLANDANLDLLYNGYFMFYLPIPVFVARSLPYKIRGKRDFESILNIESKEHEGGALAKSVIKLLNNLEISNIRTLGKIISGASCIAVFQTR